MAGKANFSVIRGDTFRKTPTFRRKDSKAPIDLTGATITGKVRFGTLETALTCTITNATAGQFKFELTPVQTSALTVGVNSIEVQCVYADTTVQTLITGNLVVTEQIV